MYLLSRCNSVTQVWRFKLIRLNRRSKQMVKAKIIMTNWEKRGGGPSQEAALIGLQIAQACGQHGSLGQDLVAMCVNDVLAQGAEPLFFLDYFSCGSLDVGVAASVVGGIARACEMAGCALLGERVHINLFPNVGWGISAVLYIISALHNKYIVTHFCIEAHYK